MYIIRSDLKAICFLGAGVLFWILMIDALRWITFDILSVVFMR